MTQSVVAKATNPVSPVSIDADGAVVVDKAGNQLAYSKSNVEFTPSSYTGKITSSEDGVTFAIASGATKIMIQNLETTDITEFAVLAFGTSAADAQTNLGKSGTTPNIISESGVVIQSGHTGTGAATFGETRILNIPVNATHAALGNGTAADTQVCMVTQGV